MPPAQSREIPVLKTGNFDAFFREKYLTKNREKESCLEMQQPADQRSEEMRGIRDTRRERIKQGSDGGHPQDHE